MCEYVCVFVLQAKIDELAHAKKEADERAAQLRSELDAANEEVEKLELEMERGFEDKVCGLEAELRRCRWGCSTKKQLTSRTRGP